MMNKILTIVIPTYNMEKYLDKCLTSLIVSDELMQLLEVLIINDGSKDRSSEIAHEYESRYPQTFRVIDKENGNYGSCINRGLKEATGEYIKILDADDSFCTNVFHQFLSWLKNQTTDMVLSPYCIVNESGVVQSEHFYSLPTEATLSFPDITEALYDSELQMHAVCYKTQNIRKIGYRQVEGISYTDQQWIFTPLVTVNTISYFGKPVYMYLVGREGQTMNPENFKRSVLQNEMCVRQILQDYTQFENLDDGQKEYISYRMQMSLCAIYKFYLIRYPELPISQLKSFDDFVSSLGKHFIELTDKETFGMTEWKYIREWHQNPHQPLSKIKVCFYTKLSHLIERLKTM